MSALHAEGSGVPCEPPAGPHGEGEKPAAKQGRAIAGASCSDRSAAGPGHRVLPEGLCFATGARAVSKTLCCLTALYPAVGVTVVDKKSGYHLEGRGWS